LVEYPLIHLLQRLERPVLLNHLEIRELNHHCKANRSSLLHKALGVSQSSHLYKTMEVNQFNSRTRIKRCPIGYIWGPGVRFIWDAT
jgi:hypothetical protein